MIGSERPVTTAAVLLGLVLASAIAVVYAKHEARKAFIELQALNEQRDALNIEWGRLQLEQSTWATHGRIERRARDQLHMAVPDPLDIVIVKP